MPIRLQTFDAVVEHAANRAAFHLLKDSLKSNGHECRDRPVGFQGGSVKRTAYWVPSVDMWAILEEFQPDFEVGKPARFWNCFGLGNPSDQGMLPITVEITPPPTTGTIPVLPGFSRRTTGIAFTLATQAE